MSVFAHHAWAINGSYVIQRSQNQQLLGTYAFGASTIAVNPFSDCVNLPSILSVRELLLVLMRYLLPTKMALAT